MPKRFTCATKLFSLIHSNTALPKPPTIVPSSMVITFLNFEKIDRFKGYNKKKYIFIYDEAHKCKNKNTINSKIMLDLSTYPVNILLLSATIIDKPLYFIPFGIVLGLYNNIQEGIDWMSRIIGNRIANPLVPIHKILFPNYASRMRIDDTIGIFKNNQVLFEGIRMKNYYEIEDKYDKLTLLLEQNKKNNKKKVNKSTKNKNKENEDEVSQEDLYDKGDVSSDESKETTKKEGIGKIQRIRQEIELLRIDTIYELTTKYLTEGKSIAIFVNFTKTIEELSQRL